MPSKATKVNQYIREAYVAWGGSFTDPDQIILDWWNDRQELENTSWYVYSEDGSILFYSKEEKEAKNFAKTLQDKHVIRKAIGMLYHD